MNYVWVLLMAVAVAYAGVTGRMDALTKEIAESAQRGVTLSIGLVGVLALWLGLMRVAEEAKLVDLLARGARPIMRRLFPEVPVEHPAMGAMLFNIAANLLGLGNAATPFGLKAMAELDELNPNKGTATDAQALFCAMNTASVQLVPSSVIALRASAGSHSPADIIGPTLLATLCGIVAAIVTSKLLAALSRQKATSVPAGLGGENV